jgi:hypothetical protein
MERRLPVRWGIPSLSHSMRPEGRLRSRDSLTAPHWSGFAVAMVAVETGRGIRPEQDGPEQGAGRPGPGRAGQAPARWLAIMDGFPAVISSSRCAKDPAG